MANETINSIPLTPPIHEVEFDVTPHGALVTTTNSFGSYSWNDVEPTMYHHLINTLLTFTASTRASADIAEWYWDFGDGTSGTGATVTHTYTTLNRGLMVHLRATATNGQVAYASMNLMLIDSGGLT